MKTEYVSLTFVRACSGFKERVQLNPGLHPTTVVVGERGCVGIRRDDEGGFDIFGTDNQHYWVAAANVIWGKKAQVDHPGELPAKPEPAPSPVAEPELAAASEIAKTPVPEELSSKFVWPDPPRPKVGRPRKK